MPIPREDIDEMKALNRELEDIRDNLLEIKIENALVDKEIECNEELLQNEMARNALAKKRLQEMTDLADEEKEKSDRFAQACFNLNKGSLARSLRFSASKLNELKEAKNLRKANIEKNLNDEIEKYIKCHPSAKYVHDRDIQQAKDERAYEKISKELKALKSSNRSAREMSDGMFKLTVLELSSQILRYRSLVNQLKNPNAIKVARGQRMRMFTPIPMSRRPSSSTGNHDPIVPQIATSSKCQEKLDTDEDPKAMSRERRVFGPRSQETDETFERGSFSRSAMRMKKPAANMAQCSPTENAKRLKVQEAPTARPSITYNARDETKKSEEVASERPKRAGSMKVPTGQSNSSQKTKKAKVTFQDVESEFSYQEMDCSKDESYYGKKAGLNNKDEAASTTDFHVVASTTITITENSHVLEIPILSGNDEISADNRNEDQPSGDHEMSLNQDDDLDDQISDWTSLDPSGMNAGDGRSLSPVPTFEDMFKEMNESGNDNATGQQQSSGNSNFQYDFGNVSVSDGNFDFFK